MDSRHRATFPRHHVGNFAVHLHHVAIDSRLVPAVGMTDVGYGQLVVVRAPEKRDVVETVAVAEHVPGDDLALALGDDPVLDAKPHVGVCVWPACDVSGSEDSFDVRLQELVDCQSIVERQPCRLSQLETAPDSNASADDVATEPGAVVQHDTLFFGGLDCLTEMKSDPLVFVHFLYEAA